MVNTDLIDAVVDCIDFIILISNDRISNVEGEISLVEKKGKASVTTIDGKVVSTEVWIANQRSEVEKWLSRINVLMSERKQLLLMKQ